MDEREGQIRTFASLMQHMATVIDIYADLYPMMRDVFESKPEMHQYLLSSLFVHDVDKADDQCVRRYQQYLYPVKGTQGNTEEYEAARQAHHSRNSHHLEFWSIHPTILTWERVAATIEMACDWEAASERLGHTARLYLEYTDLPGRMPDKLCSVFKKLLEVIEFIRQMNGKTEGLQVFQSIGGLTEQERDARYHDYCTSCSTSLIQILDVCED